ncbi:MAG: pyruvate ferredoxin oxidoreductase [Candidatus Altiarchaeota archaeon]
MTKKILETSHAIAEAVKMIKPGVIAAYPITPQTHIVERLSEMVANHEINAKYINVESEFSALSACLGAEATGVRTYTSTSSQGLALMFEVLFVVSGLRLPIGMTVANRALSAPINIWGDHQDSISVRDSGWLQFYAETSQEAFDLTIMQYKISESNDVLLPSMVCIDGFTLSHVYEPVFIPAQEEIDEFLPEYKAEIYLDPDKPMTFGPIAFPSHFMEIKYSQQKAIENSITKIKEVFKEFSEKFPVKIENSRPKNYDVVEAYKLEDSKVAFVALGSLCGTLKFMIDKFREKGEKVGLLKILCYRPFPKEEIVKNLKDMEKIAVIERAISLGANSPVFDEIRSAFYNEKKPEISSFIVGLGGRDITFGNIEKIYKLVKEGKVKKQEWIF